jgi:hypothetical protein
MKMKQVLSTVAIGLLLVSMLSFFGFSPIQRALALGTNPIVLPFYTGFENSITIDPHGRTVPYTTTSVDWQTSNFYGYSGQGSSPLLDIEQASVTPPPGYAFGSCQLAARGYFGGSNSSCYLNLFDQSSASDYNPPIQLQEHTYIDIWYCHIGVPCCMIDAQLYNIETGQWSTLGDFNDGNGHYIVDQNNVRIHPAERRSDPIGQWEFSCFDLSMIYQNDPGQWYITKIWIGMDNNPAYGAVMTGSALTYFDNLHITYGEAATQSASLPGYGLGCKAQVTASIMADSWASGPAGSGTHILYLKCSIYSNSSGTYWYDNPTYSYLNVTGPLGGSAQPFKYDDGNSCINSANLTNTDPSNPHNPDWLSFSCDGALMIAGMLAGPGGAIAVTLIDALTMIAQLIASSFQTNTQHYTYIWPQSVNMTNDYTIWPSGTYAGVYIGVTVPDGFGSFSLPIDLKSAFWYKYWDGYEYKCWHDGDVSVHVNLPVNTNPSNPISGPPSILVTTPVQDQNFGPTATISVSANVWLPACYLLASQTLNGQSGYVFTRLTDTSGNPVKTYDWQAMQWSSGPTQSITTGGTFTCNSFNLSGLSPNNYYYLYVNTMDSEGQSSSYLVVIYDAEPFVTISPSSPPTMNVSQSQQFTSAASGGISPLSYQWYLNNAAVSSATSSSWTFTPTLAGSYSVYLKVTDALGTAASSNTATVQVDFIVSVSPTSVTMDVGQSQQFNSTASCGTPPYTYRWGYSNDTSSPFLALMNANSHQPTGSSWTFTPSASGSYYVASVVQDSINCIGYSVSTVTVNAAPIVAISPSSVYMYNGYSQTFTPTVSSDILPYTYQWYLNGGAVSGATSATWTFTPSSTGSYTVYLKVTDSVGNVGTSNIANVTVVTKPSGGGCPYVYDWNGTSFVKDNNLLPASENGNGTDVKDYYLLQQSLVPTFSTRQKSVYSLQIGEFENNVDYIDQVKLIAVDHSQGTGIAVTQEGQIVTYQNPASPTSCVDNYGRSELTEISSMNGNVSDPSTYFQGNKGDWLLLDFGRVTGPYANLILRDDMKCAECIDLQIPNASGGWQTIDVLNPRDFWSIEAVNMAAYLPKTGDFIVRLLWTQTHRLDYVGLDTSPPAPVKVTTASPTLAIQSTEGDVTQKLLYDDENCVKLVNGQQITLWFTLPNAAQETTRDFILYTDGYYYTITP